MPVDSVLAIFTCHMISTWCHGLILRVYFKYDLHGYLIWIQGTYTRLVLDMLYFIHLTFLQFSVDAIREAVTKKGDVDMHSLKVSQAGMDPNPKPNTESLNLNSTPKPTRNSSQSILFISTA